MHNTDHQPSKMGTSRPGPAQAGTDEFVPEPRTLIIEDKSLRGGFVQIPRRLLHARNLSRNAKILYAVLLSYAWQEEECFPGYSRLCQDLQASENSVRVYMRELEAANLLRQKRRGLGKTNLYIIPDLRTAKIEVLEPQPFRTAKSEVLVPQESEVLEPQVSRIPIEIETVEQETDSNISNIRKASPMGSGGKRGVKNSETAPPPTGDGSSPGMESIGSVLTRQGRGAPRRNSRPRPETETTEYQRIQALIADRAREFVDSAPLKSSTTRAWNLFQAAGVPIDVFENKIFQARALTQEATARITNTTEDPIYHVLRKSKMAYFFATLEDQLNRRAGGDSSTAEEGGSGAGTPPRRGRAKQAKPDQPSSSTARRPDREGPYGAWIKS